MPHTTGIIGHWKSAVEDSSERSKHRKPNELWKTDGFPEITHTTKIGLWSAGKTDDDKLFSQALKTIPTRALKIRKT
jgi:hypothetical protein